MKKISAIAFLLSAHLLSHEQVSFYNFRSLTTNDGLSDGIVRAISQDNPALAGSFPLDIDVPAPIQTTAELRRRLGSLRRQFRILGSPRASKMSTAWRRGLAHFRATVTAMFAATSCTR